MGWRPAHPGWLAASCLVHEESDKTSSSPLRPQRACYALRVSQPQPLAEAIQALRRDPTHPVRVTVDEGLVVELRAVVLAPRVKRSAADAFRELGRWEGETGDELDALFGRQRSNRRVPELP